MRDIIALAIALQMAHGNTQQIAVVIRAALFGW